MNPSSLAHPAHLAQISPGLTLPSWAVAVLVAIVTGARGASHPRGVLRADDPDRLARIADPLWLARVDHRGIAGGSAVFGDRHAAGDAVTRVLSRALWSAVVLGVVVAHAARRAWRAM